MLSGEISTGGEKVLTEGAKVLALCGLLINLS